MAICLFVFVTVVLLAGCSGSAPTRGVTSLTGIPFSAKGCFPPGPVKLLKVYVYPDRVEPPCVEVHASQQLEVINETSEFPEYEQTLEASLPGFPTLRVIAGATALFPGMLGSHLKIGSNLLQVWPLDKGTKLLQVSPLQYTVEVWYA